MGEENAGFDLNPAGLDGDRRLGLIGPVRNEVRLGPGRRGGESDQEQRDTKLSRAAQRIHLRTQKVRLSSIKTTPMMTASSTATFSYWNPRT